MITTEITGFESALSIYNINVKTAVNEHSICTFWAVINKQDILKFISMAKNHSHADVFSAEGILLMDGLVQKVSVKQNCFDTAIFVTIISETYNLEKSFHERIFQSSSQTYCDILESYSDVRCQGYDEIYQNADIIIQKNISDFDFLKNLASVCKCGLWSNGKNITVAPHLKNQKSIFINSDIYSKNVLWLETDFDDENISVSFETMEYIQPGTVITFVNKQSNPEIDINYLNNISLIICEIIAYEKGGQTYYKYKAEKNPDFNKCYQPVVFMGHARVKNNDDPEKKGRLQLEFIDIEDMSKGQNSSLWINYLTPYAGKNNGGFVFIPDKDDIVNVVVSDEKAVAYGTVRKNSINQKCSDVNLKSILIDDEKNILIKNGKSEISLSDKNILINTDNGKIKISDVIDIQSENAELSLKNNNVELSGTQIKLKT